MEGIPWVNADAFMENVDRDQSGSVSFDEFCKGVAGLLILEADQQEEMEAKLSVLTGVTLASSAAPQTGSNKHNDRYMNMLETIKKWDQEGVVGTGGGRIGAVLNGCFAGARRPKVRYTAPCDIKAQLKAKLVFWQSCSLAHGRWHVIREHLLALSMPALESVRPSDQASASLRVDGATIGLYRH